MKVLFLGHCSFYTVSNLAVAIKTNTNDVSISVADLVKPDGSEIFNHETKIFDEVIELPKKRDTKFHAGVKRKEIFNILRDSRRKTFFKYLLHLKIRSLNNFIKAEAEEKVYSETMKKFLEKYDVLHFQYIVPEYLAPLKYIDNKKKIIFSFWGSDLFQQTGVENYRKQYEALEKADCITVNTLEMREVFLTKFGRNFLPKIRFAYFILNEEKFDKIYSMSNPDTVLKFKSKHNIEPDKKIIAIGYNASSKQRHIEILDILTGLSSEIKNKIHIVIPMAYGLQFEEKDYLEKIRNACAGSGIQATLLTEYTSGKELTEITIASEITLNLRDTDCLNASMIESLAAGNIVINGSWLPYGKLRRLGIEFYEIENLEDLKSIIPLIINNFEKEKVRFKNNYEIIREFFAAKKLVKGWTDLYDEFRN